MAENPIVIYCRGTCSIIKSTWTALLQIFFIRQSLLTWFQLNNYSSNKDRTRYVTFSLHVHVIITNNGYGNGDSVIYFEDGALAFIYLRNIDVIAPSSIMVGCRMSLRATTHNCWRCTRLQGGTVRRVFLHLWHYWYFIKAAYAW